jgi:RNA polymerase sigma-70 factor, ECF subfamily
VSELIEYCEAPQYVDALEQDLVLRAGHDQDAFAALYRRHYGAIAGYVYRRVGDPHATEDLVVETFIAAMRGIGGFRYRGSPFRAWLYRIATNRVNRWARRQRWPRWTTLENNFDLAQQPAGEHPDAGLGRKALLQIAPRFQAVLALHYLEGLGLDEIAEVLGCRVGTVKSRLSRGREALREVLRSDANHA